MRHFRRSTNANSTMFAATYEDGRTAYFVIESCAKADDYRAASVAHERQDLTVTHIFLLWAKDLISLADLAASDSRARERSCSMKPVIGPRPSSGRPTLGMQDAPTVS